MVLINSFICLIDNNMFIPWNYVQSKRNIKHLLLFSIKIIIINFAVKSISTFAFSLLSLWTQIMITWIIHKNINQNIQEIKTRQSSHQFFFLLSSSEPHFLRRIVLYFMKISFVGLCWLPSLSSISCRENKNGNCSEAIFLFLCLSFWSEKI